MPKSPGLTAWLWLFSKAGRAKATLKPLSRPGLAWPISAGLGLAHGLRPGRKSTICDGVHHGDQNIQSWRWNRNRRPVVKSVFNCREKLVEWFRSKSSLTFLASRQGRPQAGVLAGASLGFSADTWL